MTRTFKQRSLLSLFFCLAWLTAGAGAAGDTADKGYVLVLNGYNQSSAWSNSLTTPIMHKVADINNVDGYIEHLNLFTMRDSSLQETFPRYLEQKYGKTPPKALVLLGNPVMLLRKEIKELWGDVPIILCSMDTSLYNIDFYTSDGYTPPTEQKPISELADEYNLTMLYTPTYLSENVELMKRMIPGMKKLIYLDDGIYPSQQNSHRLSRIIAERYPELTYQHISAKNTTLSQLYDSLRLVDKQTGILFSTWFTDTYNSNVLANAHRSIASVSLPLFTIRYAGMDDGGMVGGYLYDENEFTAHLLSTLTLILGGKAARDIPFYRPAKGVPTFNYTTLVHKGLDPKRCPSGTVFYDKPITFLDKYKWIIMILAAAVILLVISQQRRIRVLGALRKAEQQEIDTHIKYTELINNMPVYYIKEKVLRDDNGKIVDTVLLDENKAFRRFFKAKQAESGDFEISPEITPEFLHFMEIALEEKRPITFSYYFEKFDAFFDVAVNCTNEPDVLDIFCLNSTELHHAQQQLSITNRKLSMALEVANIVPWKWNLQDHSLLCDINRPGLRAIMDGKADETALSVPENQYFAKILKEDRPRVIQAYRDLIEGRTEKVKEEYRILTHDDKHHYRVEWVEAQAAVESRDEKGHPLTLIGSSLVITERKQMEKELLTAKDRAEESNRLKSAFLANMSHEIRTPLNAIVGFSSILASGEQDPEKREYLGLIEDNNALLLQLISDILDLSKIEAGTLEFNDSEFDLNQMMNELQTTVAHRMEPKGVRVAVECGLPECRIRTEKNRLMQVLNNLLSNAEKFTERGSITLSYELRDKMLHFSVSDTGRGIPADKKNAVFGRFVKLNSFAQGTGLGLSICQMIVEHMGGTIGVESEEGKGSNFWFTIPYHPVDGAGAQPQETYLPIPVQKDKLTILIAEDNGSNYRLFESILKNDYNLVHAWDGRQAVELYKELRPQMILMDINMPEMDGYEATKEIRKLSPDVPIIAVTAFAYASDEERIIRNGFDGYMAKPINATHLKRKIADMMKQRFILL